MLKKISTMGLVAILLLVGLGRITRTVNAADNPVITLDDTTPSADVTITTDNGMSGVVYLEMLNAQVSLKNASGVETLTSKDARVLSMAIQMAANAEPHTLHIERVTNVPQASVRITSQATLPTDNLPSPDPTLKALDGLSAGSLSFASTQSLPVTVTKDASMLSAEFPGPNAGFQVMDKAGASLIDAQAGDQISALAVQLVPGKYTLSLQNAGSDSATDVTVALSAAPAMSAEFKTVSAQIAKSGNAPVSINVSNTSCVATISNTSANLRSGPGTAYSVLDGANSGQNLLVGGTNSEGGWLLVKGPNGTAWVQHDLVSMKGTCNSLASFNIPVRNTQIIVAQQFSQGSGSGGSSNNNSSPASGTVQQDPGSTSGKNDDGGGNDDHKSNPAQGSGGQNSGGHDDGGHDD